MVWEDQLLALGRITLAIFLGGVIGYERESAGKPAGLRTHMLVGGAAAMLVALGGMLAQSFTLIIPEQTLRVDPIRIIEAVVVGISFLGAGTILRRESSREIEGLTTAASILFTAGVGVAVALSQFILAVGSTILVLIVTWLVNKAYIKAQKD